MLATRENIQRLIPQRSPMVMIDELIEVSDVHAVTRLQIRPGNIFIESDHLAEPGMVENIAQTAAAQMGYQCSLKNIPVPIGYIAAIKNLEVLNLPELNSWITTSVRIINQVLDVTLAEGKIENNGVVCCTCEMRIFVKP
jgi:3-hydroxyacyl-[acyl-carrier-protein] dehydratase